MAGSTFGKVLKTTTWGESHGKAIGCVLEGMPAGFALSEEDIQPYLDRRKPGTSAITTQRREADRVEILSGVFEGKTTGAPISMMLWNSDQHSQDYDNLRDCYRPGHADYSYDAKYGIRDHRGGGRSSARETAARVAAGAVAEEFLKRELGIDFLFYTAAIGNVKIDRNRFDASLLGTNRTNMPDMEADRQAVALLEESMKNRDSVGGMVEGVITGVPAGIGDPCFDKLDAQLAQALFSIGAVKAVGIGDGSDASLLYGSENNDAFYTDEDGIIRTRTNHAGGILGGISNGAPIRVGAWFKPTPSIAREQETVRKDGTAEILSIHGRHDPVVVPRAVVVAEAMCALTILDAMLVNMSAKAENVKHFYSNSPTRS